MAEMRELAAAAARSGFFAGVETPEKALVLMAIAQAEGCAPIQAMQRYHIIKGKPSKQAWAMLADFTAAGGKVEWHEHGSQCCKATFSHPSASPVTVEWNLAKAKDAGLSGNDNWRKYPENMLHARCVSNGVRFVFPAAANGLYTPEEMQDMDGKFSAIPPEKEAPVRARVEIVAKEPEAKEPPKEKWTTAKPVPDVVLRGFPKQAQLDLRDIPLADMAIDDLEVVIEQGAKAYEAWKQMPSVAPKLLQLLQAIVAEASVLVKSHNGEVAPPPDEPPADYDPTTGEVLA